MLGNFFQKATQLSKALGVIVALIGFPAALAAAYRFSNEIYDTVTPPDIAVSFENLTLRCFYRFTTQAELERYRSGDPEIFVDNCNSARLATSFRVALRNHDSVGRTITGVSLSLNMPKGAPQINGDFDQVWHVTHRIEGVLETATRLPWGPIKLPAKSVVAQDLWLIQNLPGDSATRWVDVLAWIVDPQGPLENDRVNGIVTVSASSHETRYECSFILRPESLARFADLPPVRQFRFTGKCI